MSEKEYEKKIKAIENKINKKREVK